MNIFYSSSPRCKKRIPTSCLLVNSLRGFSLLFPFNSGRWFARNIVHDAVDVIYFIDDAAGNFIEDIVGDACPVSRHEVRRRNAAQCQRVIIGTEITHDADRADVCQSGEVLVDLTIETGLRDLLTVDGVGILNDLDLLGCDLSDDSYSKAWSWEWLTEYQVLWDSKLKAGLADLILEEKTEWLHDLLEIYIVRKSAYVVVGLDDR